MQGQAGGLHRVVCRLWSFFDNAKVKNSVSVNDCKYSVWLIVDSSAYVIGLARQCGINNFVGQLKHMVVITGYLRQQLIYIRPPLSIYRLALKLTKTRGACLY